MIDLKISQITKGGSIVEFGHSDLFVMRRLSNLMSGLLESGRSVILAFPFNICLFGAGPFVVDFDENGADEAFE